MSGRACRERARALATTRLSFCTTININAFRILGCIVLASTTSRSRRVQQYRPRVSVSDTTLENPSFSLSLSLFTAPTGARPERNGVLSAGAEYSRRPINKTQRRKAKQRASRIFPRSRSLFLPRCPVGLLPLERPPRRERPHCRTVSSRLTKRAGQCTFLLAFASASL